MEGMMAMIDECLSWGRQTDVASLTALRARLRHPEWQVRYAAAIALGDRRDPSVIPELLALLAEEDAAPLYTQEGDLVAGTPAGSNAGVSTSALTAIDAETLAAWARRGRIKQAVSWTLAEIGVATPEILTVLQRYAIDQHEDYAVRAAACRALGLLADPSSLPVLEQACDDGEWCTATEAQKACARLNA
jgi:HEAT repeat protein